MEQHGLRSRSPPEARIPRGRSTPVNVSFWLTRCVIRSLSGPRGAFLASGCREWGLFREIWKTSGRDEPFPLRSLVGTGNPRYTQGDQFGYSFAVWPPSIPNSSFSEICTAACDIFGHLVAVKKASYRDSSRDEPFKRGGRPNCSNPKTTAHKK